jgi:hypothetical protein
MQHLYSTIAASESPELDQVELGQERVSTQFMRGAPSCCLFTSEKANESTCSRHA